MNRRGRNRLFVCLVTVAALIVGAVFLNNAASIKKSLRVLYLVPKDREYRRDYHTAIESCVRDLQVWFREQIGGKTFLLHTGNVDVKHTSHNADWYNNHVPNDRADPMHYTFYNALNDAASLVGKDDANFIRFISDPDFVWLVYIDAPGGTGAGETGVAVLPGHDLEGLVGSAPNNSPVSRWIGGSGHELGHAFGLLHPGEQHRDALMQAGYATYPNCYLTAEDIDILNASPFFHDDDSELTVRVVRLKLLAKCCLIAAVIVTCWGIWRHFRGLRFNKSR